MNGRDYTKFNLLAAKREDGEREWTSTHLGEGKNLVRPGRMRRKEQLNNMCTVADTVGVFSSSSSSSFSFLLRTLFHLSHTEVMLKSDQGYRNQYEHVKFNVKFTIMKSFKDFTSSHQGKKTICCLKMCPLFIILSKKSKIHVC